MWVLNQCQVVAESGRQIDNHGPGTDRLGTSRRGKRRRKTLKTTQYSMVKGSYGSISQYVFVFLYMSVCLTHHRSFNPFRESIAWLIWRNNIIILAYITKENGFELTKKTSKRYPAKTITDADYADDLALLANTHNQAETLLHSLERAAADIGLHVNAHKTEYMCYNQTGNIATLDGASLKLIDKFTYLGSSV